MINENYDLIFRLALQPGTTKQVDGTTYVLNHNHRWTLPKDSPGQKTFFDDDPGEQAASPTFEQEAAAKDYQENGTKAKSFKAWFGDWQNGEGSKVIDNQGEPEEQAPIAVFHGTAIGGFDKFDKTKDKGSNILGPGFYFTADEEIATEYTKKDNDKTEGYAQGYLSENGEPVKTFDSDIIKFLMDNTKKVGEAGRSGSDKGVFDNPNWARYVKAALRESNGDVDKFLKLHAGDLTGKLRGKQWDNEKKTWISGVLLEPGDSDYKDTRFDRAFANFDHVSKGLSDFLFTYNVIANHLDRPQIKADVPGPELFKVYLNIRKPLDLSDVPTEQQLMGFIRKMRGGKKSLYMDDILTYDEFHDKVGIDYAIDAKDITYEHLKTIKKLMSEKRHTKDWEGWNGRKYKAGDPVFPVMHKSDKSNPNLTWGELQYIITNGQGSNGDAKDFNDQAREYGYDGMKDVGGYNIGVKDHDVWVAFESNQIKSVDNQGTFDSSNDNIRMGLQPGTTKQVNGKTYVLNQNHRWTLSKLKNEPKQKKNRARSFEELDEQAMQEMSFGETPPPNDGTLLNRDARRWYLYQETQIHKNIDKNLPPQKKAQKAFEMRNQVRRKARELMHDLETARILNETEPNFTFEDLVSRKKEKYGIRDAKQIYESIYQSANKSRKSVNESLNL